MTMFLGSWVQDGQTHVDLVDDASVVVRRFQGRASVLCPARLGDPMPRLGVSGAVLFLVSRSPTALLARLTNDFGADVAARTCVNHGHACAVVFTSTSEDADALIIALGEDVVGWEIWSYNDGIVDEDRSTVQVPERDEDWSDPPRIDAEGLGFDADSQVSQFTTNLALLSRVASRYAPELAPLVNYLREAVQDIATSLVEIARSADDEAVRRGILYEATLIETNSVLTLYTSQLGSGSLPLRSHTFAVGEYSLLGIGTMCRAAWRIYSHLNETFATHDHAGIVRRRYPIARNFDPYPASARTDFSGWRAARLSLNDLADGVVEQHRQHIPYFSSRWGFHEGLHSISMSWQCLYASATKEWNLLTVTHEYLHAHLRGIIDQVLQPRPGEGDPAAVIADMITRRDPGNTMLESMRIAYAETMVGMSGGFRLARLVASRSRAEVEVARKMDAPRLRELIRRHHDLINEILVHVLDFRYIYDGRDSEYINSIWSSWSLVPGVVNRLEEYVLRSLCALSATSPRQLEGEALFDDVAARLRVNLQAIAGRARSRHVITEAIALLEDPTALARLHVLLPAARYAVELAECFLLDPEVNAAIVADDLTTIESNRRTYNIATGDYGGERIASPIGFLLDRFQEYPDQAGGDEVEYHSVWQMLMLV